jgi:hypothetical protein
MYSNEEEDYPRRALEFLESEKNIYRYSTSRRRIRTTLL